VAVVIGADIHNHLQLQDFIHQWQMLGTPEGPLTRLGRFVSELDAAGIRPEQVVSASYEGFGEWLALDKPARAKMEYR
jgi:hypothetical protein